LPKNNVSIILSTYNESLSIEHTIRELIKHIDDVQIIVVDDDSPDNTIEIVKKIDYPKIKIFSRKKTRGLASSFLLGLINADGNILGWVDSNMGGVIKNYPEMIAKLEEYDIAILSRYVDGSKDERNKFRVIISYLLNKFSRIVLRTNIKDISSGLFVMKRQVLENTVPISYGHGEFFVEFLYRAQKKGNKIIELPYIHPIDIEGNSKSFPNLFRFSQLGFFYILRIFRTIFGRE